MLNQFLEELHRLHDADRVAALDGVALFGHLRFAGTGGTVGVQSDFAS